MVYFSLFFQLNYLHIIILLIYFNWVLLSLKYLGSIFFWWLLKHILFVIRSSVLACGKPSGQWQKDNLGCWRIEYLWTPRWSNQCSSQQYWSLQLCQWCLDTKFNTAIPTQWRNKFDLNEWVKSQLNNFKLTIKTLLCCQHNNQNILQCGLKPLFKFEKWLNKLARCGIKQQFFLTFIKVYLVFRLIQKLAY